MKQTAVEWLAEKVNSKNFIKYDDFFKLIEKAKEMEKQQMIDCGNSCALMQYIHVDRVSQMSNEEVEKLAEEDNITFGEQYYNETFNK